MKDYGHTGEQGVSLVIAELLARGLRPYRPVVDNHGVDLMLLDGTRLQVKAANLSKAYTKDRRTGESHHRGRMCYQFSTQRTVIGTNEKLRRVGITYEYRNFADEVDFLIFVGIDEHRFWIVPSEHMNDCCHVTIAQGESQAKNGPRWKFWQEIRDGEGRWGLLAHHNPVDEIDVDLLYGRGDTTELPASVAA